MRLGRGVLVSLGAPSALLQPEPMEDGPQKPAVRRLHRDEFAAAAAAAAAAATVRCCRRRFALRPVQALPASSRLRHVVPPVLDPLQQTPACLPAPAARLLLTCAPLSPPQVWLPGDEMGEGETLQYDPSVYDCMSAMSLDWPCLSFDVLRDHLGGPRAAFPHTLFMVAGTQVGGEGEGVGGDVG